MSAVLIEITLPAAPAQAGQHAKRVVTITISGTPQPPCDADVMARTLAPVTVDASATVQVSVVEVLSNGKQSAPCVSPAIVPADHAEAVAADPAGFVFKVTPIAAP